MFYLAYDEETGAIITFYHSEIHPNIPSNTIPITPEQHQYYHANIERVKVDLETKEIIVEEDINEEDITTEVVENIES